MNRTVNFLFLEICFHQEIYACPQRFLGDIWTSCYSNDIFLLFDTHIFNWVQFSITGSMLQICSLESNILLLNKLLLYNRTNFTRSVVLILIQLQSISYLTIFAFRLFLASIGWLFTIGFLDARSDATVGSFFGAEFLAAALLTSATDAAKPAFFRNIRSDRRCGPASPPLFSSLFLS